MKWYKITKGNWKKYIKKFEKRKKIKNTPKKEKNDPKTSTVNTTFFEHTLKKFTYANDIHTSNKDWCFMIERGKILCLWGSIQEIRQIFIFVWWNILQPHMASEVLKVF